VAATAALGALILSASTVVAVEAPAAAGGDRGALYLAISGVLVALITSGFAVFRDRKPEPPAARYIDPPSSNELPRQTSDLLADEMARVRELRAESDRLRTEVDLWQERAYSAGWRP
jgi:hypothetical protein